MNAASYHSMSEKPERTRQGVDRLLSSAARAIARFLLSVLVGLCLIAATVFSFLCLALVMLDSDGDGFGRLRITLALSLAVLLWLPVAAVWLFKHSANERN